MQRQTQWPDFTLPHRERWIKFFCNGRSEVEMRERAPLEYLQHIEDIKSSGRFKEWQVRQAEESLRLVLPCLNDSPDWAKIGYNRQEKEAVSALLMEVGRFAQSSRSQTRIAVFRS